jgi:hypothetical protein
MHTMRLFEAQPVESEPLSQMDLPLPQPGPGQVRLKVHFCGVCHTDLHTVEGDIQPPRLPITPGHQVVGEIDALGGETPDRRIGERVGVPWLFSACGACEYCQRGESNLCPSARFTGFHQDGGYAEYMLADSAFVLPIPLEIEDEQAAPLLCAGIIGYRSLRKADLQPGERLGLVGFGASAHLAIQVAHHWDCQVFVFYPLCRSPAPCPRAGGCLGRRHPRHLTGSPRQGCHLCPQWWFGAPGVGEASPGRHACNQRYPYVSHPGNALPADLWGAHSAQCRQRHLPRRAGIP